MTTHQNNIQRTADIAIIGGGIIGMSCAYELARQSKLRIVLFDKQNPASGTTGGSGGVICLHDMGEIYAYLTLKGYARIQQLHREHNFGYQAWGALGVVYEPGQFPPTAKSIRRTFCPRRKEHLSTRFSGARRAYPSLSLDQAGTSRRGRALSKPGLYRPV